MVKNTVLAITPEPDMLETSGLAQNVLSILSTLIAQYILQFFGNIISIFFL